MTDSTTYATITVDGFVSNSTPDDSLYDINPKNHKSIINEWDKFYLDMAKNIAYKSKDPSTKCGAVIVRPDRSQCSIGFNGFPKKMPDNPEWYQNREDKYSRIIHAEINSLIFAREQVTGYTLYTYPFLSCDRCFVQLVQAGITRFVSPQATEDQLTRWGDSFEKVRRYAKEMDIIIDEYYIPSGGEMVISGGTDFIPMSPGIVTFHK